MINKIYQCMFAGGMLLFIASCTKETAVDEFQKFGQVYVRNASPHNQLFASIDSFELVVSNTYTKIKPGTNLLKISGMGSSPPYVLYPLLDTSITIEVDKENHYSFFQPSLDISPRLLLNEQVREAYPATGYVKIKIANYAKHCYPDDMDLQMKMSDNDFNSIATDTIESVKLAEFGIMVNFENFTTTIRDHRL